MLQLDGSLYSWGSSQHYSTWLEVDTADYHVHGYYILYAHDLKMLIILEVVSPPALPHTKESDSLLKVQFA